MNQTPKHTPAVSIKLNVCTPGLHSPPYSCCPLTLRSNKKSAHSACQAAVEELGEQGSIDRVLRHRNEPRTQQRARSPALDGPRRSHFHVRIPSCRAATARQHRVGSGGDQNFVLDKKSKPGPASTLYTPTRRRNYSHLLLLEGWGLRGGRHQKRTDSAAGSLATLNEPSVGGRRHAPRLRARAAALYLSRK